MKELQYSDLLDVFWRASAWSVAFISQLFSEDSWGNRKTGIITPPATSHYCRDDNKEYKALLGAVVVEVKTTLTVSTEH